MNLQNPLNFWDHIKDVRRRKRIILGLTKPFLGEIPVVKPKKATPKKRNPKPRKRKNVFLATDFVQWAKTENPPKSAFENGRAFIFFLKKRGFEELGSGAFGSVLAKKGSDRVVKVLRNINRDGWFDYVYWASKEGYSGSFAPRVFSFKRYPGKQDQPFGVAVMERIDRTFYKVNGSEPICLLPEMLGYLQHNNPMAKSVVEQLAPGMVEFMDKLSNKFDSKIDNHAGNLMVRKDGTFVFADPIGGWNATKTVTRLRAKDFTSLAPANLLGVIGKCPWITGEMKIKHALFH